MIKTNTLNNNSYETIVSRTAKSGNKLKFSKTYPAYIILVFFIGLSFLVWYIFEQKVRLDNQAGFDKAVTSVMTRVDRSYQTHLQVLGSIRGLYDNLVQVVRDYFILYASVPTKTYPSIVSLMSVQNVRKENLESYLHYVRSQGYYDYNIFPKVDRNVYLPIEFIMPDTLSGYIRGFDLATNPSLMEEIHKSIAENVITAAPMFNFRVKDTLSFFIMSPFFNKNVPLNHQGNRENNFAGLAVLEINLPVFFEKALGSGVPSDTSIVFECVYKDTGKTPIRLYSSNNLGILASGYKPLLTNEMAFKIADKNLYIKFATIPDYGGAFQKYLPYLSFIISLILSFAFFGFVLSVITSRTRAIELAEQMTRSQRRIVTASQDIIAVMDLKGEWKSMNPASIHILDYEPYELIGKNIRDVLLEPAEANSLLVFHDLTEDEYTSRSVVQLKTQNNDIKWISWSFTYSQLDKLIYCIGRDVTLEKIAEEQARLKSKQIQLAEQLTHEVSEFKSYFMANLSFQFRNSLTSIIGYHQLISQKKYDSTEEHDSYLKMASDSAEELYTSVTDMVDVARGNDSSTAKDLSTIHIDKAAEELTEKIGNHIDADKKIIINVTNESMSAVIFANHHLFVQALTNIIEALSEELSVSEITIMAQENPYESATELQITTNSNPFASEMIDLYRKNSVNIIDALKYDKKDFLLKLTLGISNLRMMNGSVIVDTFGPSEGNILLITMPLYKQQDM